MKKYILLFSLLLAFTSCRVSLVPAYDDGIVKQIELVAKASDKLLLELIEAEPKERAYNLYKARYIDVQVELGDLLRKEKNRLKGDELVSITTNIIEQFNNYKERHKTDDTTIKSAVLILQREYISDHFNTLLIAEKALP